MKLDIKYKEILPYVDNGLITERAHPSNPDLRIFNYTARCQYEQKWDDVTMQCRGLIMDVSKDEIIARPFPKFFNLEEMYPTALIDIVADNDDEPIVINKLDGSLGILYWNDDRPEIATRGSFESDQAKWATSWLQRNIKDTSQFDKNVTYLFEIIANFNKIVVDYNFEGLVLISAIDIKTGKELFWDWNKNDFDFVGLYIQGLKAAEQRNYDLNVFDDFQMEEFKQKSSVNEEGVVIFLPKANERFKVKINEYVRLHKILTGLTPKKIWEGLKNGNEVMDILSDVPDEVYGWVDKWVCKIKSDYEEIEKQAIKQYRFVQDMPTRKEQALYLKDFEYKGIVFSMLDEKEYSDSIWKLIKPSSEEVFKQEI